MPKGVTNKGYTSEFKQKVVEAVLNEGLSYKEAQAGHYIVSSSLSLSPIIAPYINLSANMQQSKSQFFLYTEQNGEE